MGANVVASKNCGNWMVCAEQLLVDPCTSERFVEKILKSLVNKFDDNIKWFLELQSYRELVEIIELI